MNVLITSARMPFALDEIRKLGRRGHRVFASDSLWSAPGSHSRFVQKAFVTTSPRLEPEEFIAQLRNIVSEHAIELLIPCFEEVFWIVRHARELGDVEVFAPELATLERLHDKTRFIELASDLGLRVPRTVVARDDAELDAGIERYGQFFAQPAFSRGGVDLLTNVGPLAGVRRRSDCRPTSNSPWIVQEFVVGTDLCTYGVARQGQLCAHVAYVHPRTIEHTGGITFLSIEDDEALAAVEALVASTRYHGQIAFDFIRSEKGLYCIECNPRPTLGVALLDDEMFAKAALEGVSSSAKVVPVGIKRKIGWGLVRNVLRNPRELRRDVRAFSTGGPDIHLDLRDPAPALYQMIAALVALRREHDAVSYLPEHSRMVAAYLYDSAWDGSWLHAA